MIETLNSKYSVALKEKKNPTLRTKILLGQRDLKLNIKKKGETRYRRVHVETFGPLPDFNFTKISSLSPGSPPGRKSVSEEEIPVRSRSRKRTLRSESKSPPPIPSRPKIQDRSYDDAGMNF